MVLVAGMVRSYKGHGYSEVMRGLDHGYGEVAEMVWSEEMVRL